MKSRGQDNVRENGYAMAVLLVGMSIAAIMLTVAMPVWKQMARREKEEELVFRGQQYVHALRLFSRKYANASPPTLDVLVQQRFIRKKYKDPITNDDFQLVLAGQSVPGASTSVQPARGGTGGASGTSGSSAGPSGFSPLGGQRPGGPGPATGGRGISAGLTGGPGAPGAGPVGGVIGVVSKSKDKSIRLYNGRSHYNEWAFINTPSAPAPGAGAPGVGGPGQRGQPGQPGGQRGQNPFGPQGPGGRGPGTTPNNPSGRPGGPGQPPPGPQRGRGGFSPFQPGQPIQPIQPVQPGRGRGA